MSDERQRRADRKGAKPPKRLDQTAFLDYQGTDRYVLAALAAFWLEQPINSKQWAEVARRLKGTR